MQEKTNQLNSTMAEVGNNQRGNESRICQGWREPAVQRSRMGRPSRLAACRESREPARKKTRIDGRAEAHITDPRTLLALPPGAKNKPIPKRDAPPRMLLRQMFGIGRLASSLFSMSKGDGRTPRNACPTQPTRLSRPHQAVPPISFLLQTATSSVSPVRMRIAPLSSATKILPSPT